MLPGFTAETLFKSRHPYPGKRARSDGAEIVLAAPCCSACDDICAELPNSQACRRCPTICTDCGDSGPGETPQCPNAAACRRKCGDDFNYCLNFVAWPFGFLICPIQAAACYAGCPTC